MNSVVRLIFNKGFIEKKRFVDSVNSARNLLEKQKNASSRSPKIKIKRLKRKCGFVSTVPKWILNLMNKSGSQ